MGGYACYQDKTKTPDRNDLKLGTVVVLDTLSKPVDFGFKRSMVRVSIIGLRRSTAARICISTECIFYCSCEIDTARTVFYKLSCYVLSRIRDHRACSSTRFTAIKCEDYWSTDADRSAVQLDPTAATLIQTAASDPWRIQASIEQPQFTERTGVR